MPTFLDDADRWLFLKLVDDQVNEGALIVHAYCLMLNHFHLLAETPQGGLGKSMQEILGPYAGRFNYRHQRVGHLWQGRYKAILVEDGEYFLDCSRYIHLNPTASNCTQSPQEYRWSSYRNYVGGVPTVDWVATDRTMVWFKDSDAYRRFVEAGRDKGTISPFECASAGIAWGSNNFVAGIRTLATDLEESSAQAEVPCLRRLQQGEALTVEKIRDAVARVFIKFSACQKRRILIYALRERTSLKSCEIARITGRTPSAVTHAVKSISSRLKMDSRLVCLYGRLLSELQGKDGEGWGRVLNF